MRGAGKETVGAKGNEKTKENARETRKMRETIHEENEKN
jgi:hypothetical protein